METLFYTYNINILELWGPLVPLLYLYFRPMWDAITILGRMSLLVDGAKKKFTILSIATLT